MSNLSDEDEPQSDNNDEEDLKSFEAEEADDNDDFSQSVDTEMFDLIRNRPGPPIRATLPPKQQHKPDSTKKTRPKLRVTSNPPSVEVKPGVKEPKDPVLPRLHASKMLRLAPSKYPTEIENGVRKSKPPLTEGLPDPFGTFLDILRDYMGVRPDLLDFDVIENRVLSSTKAADESDSEHFQRVASAMQIINTIKSSRVTALKDIAELSQHQINDNRQHERYKCAIQIRRDKTNSDILKQSVETATAQLELDKKERLQAETKYPTAKIGSLRAVSKLARWKAYPERPMVDYNIFDVNTRQTCNAEERLIYLDNVLY